jgi:tetratricopeptide (TPR) repeat protein
MVVKEYGGLSMGFRFYKRIKIAPGISMNLSKSGPSFSFGPRGMKYTVGPKGVRQTFGIPGTGIYYTTSKKWGKEDATRSEKQTNSIPKLTFIKGLFASEETKAFSNGINAFINGETDKAFIFFSKNIKNIDSLFMSGFISLGKQNYSDAEYYFKMCLGKDILLGDTISEFSGDFELALEITDFIEAPIKIDKRGVILSLVESYQKQNKNELAISILQELWEENSSDKVVCLSMIDLVGNWINGPVEYFSNIIEMTQFIENDEPIDTNILYLRGYLLYRMGVIEAGIKQLSNILRKTKARPIELILKIRFMRGRIYEELGKLEKARVDYEKIYFENPNFNDVKSRLGIS